MLNKFYFYHAIGILYFTCKNMISLYGVSESIRLLNYLCSQTFLNKMKTEFNEIANPATLCRVCMAAEEDHFSNLYEEPPSSQPPISLHEMLQVICAPVFASSDSSDVPEMPTRVCNVCRDAIIAAFNLHQQCIESDRRLGELLTFEQEFDYPKSNEELEDFSVVVNEVVMPTENAGDVSKTCSECGKAFSRRFTLRRHQRNGVCPGKSNDTNLKDPLFDECRLPKNCLVCDREFDSQLTLDKHLQSGVCPNKRKKRFVGDGTSKSIRDSKTCAQCGKVFARRYTLFRHKRTGSCAGTDPKMFLCRLCDKFFNTPNALQGHRKKCHGSNADSIISAPGTEFCSEDKMESDERKPDEVTDGPSMSSKNIVMIKVEALDLMDDNGHENRSFNCAENTTVKTENEQALQRVTTEDKKTCSVCSETVEDIAKLKIHMRICHQLYLCELCDTVFLTRHVLWYHTLKHKEPNVTCSVCGKKLSSKYNLELHMLRHAGKKMHACELCSMRFTTSGAKAAHLRIHKKERPFVCDICGKRVVSKASLAKHVKEIHESKQTYRY